MLVGLGSLVRVAMGLVINNREHHDQHVDDRPPLHRRLILMPDIVLMNYFPTTYRSDLDIALDHCHA